MDEGTDRHRGPARPQTDSRAGPWLPSRNLPAPRTSPSEPWLTVTLGPRIAGGPAAGVAGETPGRKSLCGPPRGPGRSGLLARGRGAVRSQLP